ncbi:MAG: hypothetical protein FRX48_03032 [Lasallia pustulata]|uniref:Uncharacterized protein n=1 Tax=Lasallia pustulata TaxID=136370 RepID=A0A5M8PUI2_9LECA|nr:MAG: hypothetical protein FRX48_03032 [Lasallia pustulata]
MADVRSLLRNERASRRIAHPQASYTNTGTLICLICHTQVKSESLWDTHLKSAPHVKRFQSLRGAASNPTGDTNGTKKRKADDGEGDSRKKSKPIDGLPDGFFDESSSSPGVRNDFDPEPEDMDENPLKDTAPADAAPTEQQAHSAGVPAGFFDASAKGAPVPTTAIDEDEWAAFERDVATPPPEVSVAPSALIAAATISAAPLSAAEIAARSREEASTQTKERREVELEGEKEDAALRLEEEFAEMEGLEERVKRLREKREDLRSKREEEARVQEGTEAMDGVEGAQTEGNDDDDDDDNDEGYEWDGWRLR